MADSRLVLLKIFAMFLVMLLGWFARHREYLTAQVTSTLSRFVVDFTMPALIFTQLLRTVDAGTLKASWYLPLLGALVLLLGQGVGLISMPFFSRRDQRGTYLFLIAVANWVYLPLPIVDALYHAEGVRVILLTNVGSQLVLWTLGVWTLRGGKPDLASLRKLVTNPGLIATAIGIILALTLPLTHTLEQVDPITASPLLLTAGALVQALKMIGDLTIPLSLVVIGAQLGELDLSDHRPSRTLVGVLISRLLLTPVCAVALVVLIAHLGITLPVVPRMTSYIIAAMPVAVSCSIFTEHFGGDTPLAARAIFYSTAISIASVPLLFYLIQRGGW